MFIKILKLYPTAILQSQEPDLYQAGHYHWFYDISNRQWFGIPSEDIQTKELLLLKSLFEYFEPYNRNEKMQSWFDFLYANGTEPLGEKKERCRIIHFHCSSENLDQENVEQALKGFFSENIILLWENSSQGIIIEREGKALLQVDDFLSISNTLESELFLKVTFYIGKFHEVNKRMKTIFRMDKACFQKALEHTPIARTFTFENIFPIMVALQMPVELSQALSVQLLEEMQEDKELLTTVQVFIENNMNATLTAKKLYIHRNTLQYRLEKFSEKTGVTLKDFHSAYTIYSACLFYKQNS